MRLSILCSAHGAPVRHSIKHGLWCMTPSTADSCQHDDDEMQALAGDPRFVLVQDEQRGADRLLVLA